MEKIYILDKLVAISNGWRERAKSELFTERERDVYNDCADEIESLLEDAAAV